MRTGPNRKGVFEPTGATKILVEEAGATSEGTGGDIAVGAIVSVQFA